MCKKKKTNILKYIKINSKTLNYGWSKCGLNYIRDILFGIVICKGEKLLKDLSSWRNVEQWKDTVTMHLHIIGHINDIDCNKVAAHFDYEDVCCIEILDTNNRIT